MYVANVLGTHFCRRKIPKINLNGFSLLKSDDFEREPVNYVVSAGVGTAGTIETDIFTTDTGETWNVVNGVWARDTNGLYLASSGGTGKILHYIPKTGKSSADGVLESRIIWYDKMGFSFRYDGNASTGKIFFAVVNNGECYISLWDFDAWTETRLATNNNVILTQGQEYIIRLELTGNNITLKLDGTTILTATNANNATTGVYHGLYHYSTNYNCRWKTFIHTTPITEISIIGDIWDKEYIDGKAAISTDFAKTGTKSLRMELNSTDADVSGSKRCELAIKTAEQPREEHWYMFSTYLPNGGEEDYALDQSSTESIAQWHQTSDAEDFGGAVPLYLATRNGRYSVRINSCVDAVATSENITQNFFDLGVYAVDKGRWVDWAFHVRWGWLEEHRPLVEVFKNGKRILRSTIPNTYNDSVGVYQKLGIYKWDWKDTPENSVLTQRVVYYDCVKDYKR
jgi:hypothetical protein